MMSFLADAIKLMGSLANLGASPAVQQLVLAFLADKMGVDQRVLDAAITAAKEPQPPKES